MKHAIINRKREVYNEDVELIQTLEDKIGEPCFYMFLPYNESLTRNDYKIIDDELQIKLYDLVLEKEHMLSEMYQRLNDASKNTPDWYNNKFFCGRTIKLPTMPYRYA